MADIKSIFKKLGSMANNSLANNTQADEGQKLTPNEVELKSFERREFLDNVKIKLREMRLKNSMLGTNNGDHILMKQKSILSNENIFNKEKSLLNEGNTILKNEKSLLNSGNNILNSGNNLLNSGNNILNSGGNLLS